MFPFSGGINGDDPIPDDEFEDLFDDEPGAIYLGNGVFGSILDDEDEDEEDEWQHENDDD